MVQTRFPPAVSQAKFRYAPLARPDLAERQPELLAYHLTAAGDIDRGLGLPPPCPIHRSAIDAKSSCAGEGGLALDGAARSSGRNHPPRFRSASFSISLINSIGSWPNSESLIKLSGLGKLVLVCGIFSRALQRVVRRFPVRVEILRIRSNLPMFIKIVPRRHIASTPPARPVRRSR